MTDILIPLIVLLMIPLGFGLKFIYKQNKLLSKVIVSLVILFYFIGFIGINFFASIYKDLPVLYITMPFVNDIELINWGKPYSFLVYYDQKDWFNKDILVDISSNNNTNSKLLVLCDKARLSISSLKLSSYKYGIKNIEISDIHSVFNSEGNIDLSLLSGRFDYILVYTIGLQVVRIMIKRKMLLLLIRT